MAEIHPSAVVHDGAELAPDVEIGPYSIIGARVTLAAGVRIHSHVVISGVTQIGEGTIVYSHAAIGGPPQFRGDPGKDARVVIGAENIIRELVTINGGSVKGGGITKVGSRGYFMATSHVAHDCHVGDGVTLAHGAAVGGHVTIEDGVNIGGMAAIQQFGHIGRYAFVGGVSGVTEDVIPYGMVWGNRAHLQGLNLIGLKRRGLSRERIHTLRRVFREVFFGVGNLLVRAQNACERWPDIPEVLDIVRFIQAERKRPICMPSRPEHVGEEPELTQNGSE
jgi:UDP-N-acetylglucosamine acyltransferase